MDENNVSEPHDCKVVPLHNGRTQAVEHIQGWGADLARNKRPAYPMERTPPRLEAAPVHEPVQQQSAVEIFCSTERGGITPIFGTTVPPSGVSGKLRAWGYRYSENNILRWLILMFADRIDTLEGVGEDLRQGRLPNIPAEMGIRAELRHNPVGFAKKAVATTAVLGLAIYLLKQRDKKADRR